MSTRLKILTKKIKSGTIKALKNFNMINDGDLVMVCLSGGKDSHTLLDILIQLQSILPIKYELIAVNIDQGQPNYPKEVLPDYLSNNSINHKIIFQNTYTTVNNIIPENKTKCSLCSRLRRGIIYKTAKELGANKIALGHHRDDILETLFLNMFFNGKLKAMPAKLLSDDAKNIIIRPLAFVTEKDIIKYAELKQFPIIPCNFCGSQTNSQRLAVKKMLSDWSKAQPNVVNNIYSAMQNIIPSHLLDTQLYNFMDLSSPSATKSTIST